MEPVPVKEEELTWSEDELVAKMQDIIHFFLDVLCHADCRMCVIGWTTGQVGSAIKT
jgi:hypothetical protein